MTLSLPGPILCCGEVLVRLSTQAGTPLANGDELRVHVGGAESNVAALLAQLGHEVEMLTALPPSALGDRCVADLLRHGIGTSKLVRAEGRAGLYFFEANGSGGRIIYDREHTAFAGGAGTFDWRSLATHARWFHLSGINLALGGEPARSALAGAAAMKDVGVPVSFDVNHRASLWEGKPEAELAKVRDVAAMADILFASPLDICRLLGGATSEAGAAARAAFAEFEQLRLIASTRRAVEYGRQHLSARVDTRDGGFETDAAPLANVIDRIGSGDAFAGAVIDQLLSGGTPERCARAGLAAAVAKHGIVGDRWIGTRQELEAFDPFMIGDVRR